MDPNKTVQFNTTSKLLNNPSLQSKTSKTTSILIPNTLIKRVFFHNAFLLACQGGKHYNLKINQFNFCDNGGIDFQRFQAKNNQRGVIGSAAQKVPILANLPNFRGPCYDYRLYFEKRPLDAN
ncbi:35075_t:CDS:2 [Racocetra persica]|uniref:35075_t:CDS:1 n=1 Tax=Racocetra persica TaxID=160502 RepID=A0ACA9MIA8_9GLOM|nr:35075_t:CDS:2 [Racocetra persica]